MIFRLQYCNDSGDTAIIDIETKIGVGVQEIEGSGNPFSLQYKTEKSDKSGRFMTSSADIEIYENEFFNIDILKTSSETDIKVSYYINEVLEWQGFILPDFFSKEIKDNAVISMTATDRVSTLKSVTLDNLDEDVRIRDVAKLCLDKTGLILPLLTLADFVNEEGGNLFNTYIQSQRLNDEKGRSISCYDILESILISSNAQLVQRKGYWQIINKYQLEQGVGKNYSTLSNFTNWAKSIHNFEFIGKGAIRTITPVASSVGVFQEYGGGQKYPSNYDFDEVGGWTAKNGFVYKRDNREIIEYNKIGEYIVPTYGAATENYYLVNNNAINFINPTDIIGEPYLESTKVNVPFSSSRVEINIDINAIAPKAMFIGLPLVGSASVNYAVVAESTTETLILNNSGQFVTLANGKDNFQRLKFDLGNDYEVLTKGDSIKGLLEVEGDVSDYKISVRIYGSGEILTTFVNFLSYTFKSEKEIAKGTLYKTTQGTNFTKEHDVETTVFGDYLTKGVNGYFYDYQNDDTSSLIAQGGAKTELWTAPNETESLPLLQQISRQKARLFSIAHDIVRGDIKMGSFDPLTIFKDCNNYEYVVVSATFDFLRSVANVEIEQILYDSNISRRDYIYSYFGEGESSIKSVGGISGGGVGAGGGGGMTSSQLEMLHSHLNKSLLDTITQEMLDNALREMLGVESTEEVTDENYFSALRTLKEILDNNEVLKDLFLSKTSNDTAQGFIEFLKGISVEELATLTQGLEVGDYTSGLLGSGASLKMNNGISELEVDKITVRMIATFFEIVVSKLRHINGGLVLSRGSMTCSRVVDDTDSWQCFFERGENNEISNTFVVNDQARCQVFNVGNPKFYWRLVTEVGDDWIKLSKTEGVGDSIPEAGDDIVQLGYQGEDLEHVKRLNAQIIDESGISQYVEIDSFTLEGKRRNFISADGTGSQFTGKVSFKNAGEDYDLSDWSHETETAIEDVHDEIDSLGLVNRNYAYIRDTTYGTSIFVSNDFPRNSKQYLSISLWGNFEGFANVNPFSEIFFGGDFDSGIVGYTYIRKSVNHIVYEGGYVDLSLEEDEDLTLSMYGMAPESLITKVKIDIGTKATDWTPAPEEVQTAIDKAQADANTSLAKTKFMTEIDGGLIYSAIMKLYDAGGTGDEMAGVSGIVGALKNNPAFWAGGSYDQAIGGTAKAIIRHDGSSKFTDAEIEGRVTATSGSFKGQVISKDALIEGALTTPFKDGYYVISEEGEPSTVSTLGLHNNNCVVIPGEGAGYFNVFNMPFTPEYNGFRAIILNTDWGTSEALGSIQASAPTGKYFQDSGEYTSTLVVKPNEGVELIGVGNGNVFEGWLILNKFIYGKEVSEQYKTLESDTFAIPSNTNYTLRQSSPLSILTSVGTNSTLIRIYMDNTNQVKDGTIKWILNSTPTTVDYGLTGNIRNHSEGFEKLQAWSITPFIHYGGYWYKHSDRK